MASVRANVHMMSLRHLPLCRAHAPRPHAGPIDPVIAPGGESVYVGIDILTTKWCVSDLACTHTH